MNPNMRLPAAMLREFSYRGYVDKVVGVFILLMLEHQISYNLMEDIMNDSSDGV